MTSEEIPTTNGVSTVGEESTMEGVTNGEVKTEEEVIKVKEEKSIMEMIAAGDFDAEENAAAGDASTDDKSDQPTEVKIKEEKVSEEVLKEASEEKSKEVSDEEKKEEGESTSAAAGEEVGSGKLVI